MSFLKVNFLYRFATYSIIYVKRGIKDGFRENISRIFYNCISLYLISIKSKELIQAENMECQI